MTAFAICSYARPPLPRSCYQKPPPHVDSPPSLSSQFHCVRCHALFCDLLNTDMSCRTSHNDDSALIDCTAREVLWGLDGTWDINPPDA
ncbi:hypothetical protein BDR03DRAFT_974316 [Suillus americanus]|nr:hypothetical protein BDR03DRAFT_974316 [Suillus americanus]